MYAMYAIAMYATAMYATAVCATAIRATAFFDANLSGCMFTKRSAPGEVYTQTYDYRLVTSPSDLGTIITY